LIGPDGVFQMRCYFNVGSCASQVQVLFGANHAIMVNYKLRLD